MVIAGPIFPLNYAQNKNEVNFSHVQIAYFSHLDQQQQHQRHVLQHQDATRHQCVHHEGL